MKIFTFEGLAFEIVVAVCVWGYLFDAPDQVVVGIVEAVAGGTHHPDAIDQPDCWPKYPDTSYPLWYPFSRDHHGLAYPWKSKDVHIYLWRKKIQFSLQKTCRPQGQTHKRLKNVNDYCYFMGAHLYCSSYSQLAGPIDLTSHYYQSALYILHWCKSHKKYLRALLRILASSAVGNSFLQFWDSMLVGVEDVGMGNNQKLKHPFSYMYLLSKVKWIYMYIWLNLIWSSWDVDRQLATLKSSWFF